MHASHGQRLLNFCRVVADSVAAQLHSPFSGFLGPQVSAASKFHDVGCRSDLCLKESSSEARGSHCSVHATEFRSRAPLHHFVFATSCQLQIVQTSYRTAVDADKMGMVSFITRVSIGSFETPNVISQLGSP